ncbi:MAG TPA: response regulator [Nitrososphaeraceae archaeon]|jgi:DNA-binding response OmpR family regulator|nr:response regulator [Nitrososphaeraceae archaeon]
MPKVKLLFIVDDEPDTCLTLTIVLEDNGFVVHAFDDPLLALENFRKDLYDLLILDIKMEKMDGFQLYKEIKKIDNKVKVCFLTAQEFIDVFSNLKENQFIQKPIENEELIKIIDKITCETTTHHY